MEERIGGWVLSGRAWWISDDRRVSLMRRDDGWAVVTARCDDLRALNGVGIWLHRPTGLTRADLVAVISEMLETELRFSRGPTRYELVGAHACLVKEEGRWSFESSLEHLRDPPAQRATDRMSGERFKTRREALERFDRELRDYERLVRAPSARSV